MWDLEDLEGQDLDWSHNTKQKKLAGGRAQGDGQPWCESPPQSQSPCHKSEGGVIWAPDLSFDRPVAVRYSVRSCLGQSDGTSQASNLCMIDKDNLNEVAALFRSSRARQTEIVGQDQSGGWLALQMHEAQDSRRLLSHACAE